MFADDLEFKTQNVKGWNLKPDILVHGSPCFVGDTLVLTNHGYIPIAKLADFSGICAMGHDGNYYAITNWINQGIKPTLKITPYASHEIRCTSNHKFYVRKKGREYDGHTYHRTFQHPEWVEAGGAYHRPLYGDACQSVQRTP